MENLYEIYDLYWYKYADQRIIDYPLMGSPIPIIIILSAYWCMIKKGPQWMANKPAFNIKSLIQAYNTIQIVVCGVLGIRVAYLISQGNLRCTVHSTNSEYDLTFVFYTWVYILLKVLDLMDTVFFVMRKKFQLLTTLHTYHHTIMAVVTILFGRYVPAGEFAIMGTLNSLVHSVMYFYYFYCLHSGSRQAIWWKKYITQMQLGQFIFLFIFYSYKLFFVNDCDYPKFILVFAQTQVLTMLYLFGNYYYNAFIVPKETKPEVNNNLGAKKVT